MKRGVWLTVATLLTLAIGLVAWFGPSRRTPSRSWPTEASLRDAVSKAHREAPYATSLPIFPGEPGEPVRVLLGGGPRKQWSFSVAGPVRLESPTGEVLWQGDWPTAQTCRATASGGLEIGDLKLEVSQVDIVPVRVVNVVIGDRAYAGRLRLRNSGDDKLEAINVVNMADYLASVVQGEMPDSFGPAALEAQAIAARTYARYKQASAPRTASFDVYDDTRSQMYRGRWQVKNGELQSVVSPASTAAALKTSGRTLMCDGKLFCSFYSACCGGHTLSGREVFRVNHRTLDATPCPWCRGAPRYRWRRTLTAAEFLPRLEKYLAAKGRGVGVIERVETAPRKAGLLPVLRIVGNEGVESLRSDAFRSAALSDQSLPSAMFTLTTDGPTWRLEGEGFGHGVGLCQWGAAGMAKAGKSCDEILRHYYPGCTIEQSR